MQRDEVIRGDRGACVVERSRVVRQLEGPQAQCFGEPEAGAPRFLRLARDGGPGAVELLGAARARERLERMEPEPSLVRLECRQWRGTGNVCDPGSDVDRAGDVCDRPVGHAEQDELGRLARGDVPLAEASGDGRADAAGADDLDAAEHFELQFRSGYRA